LTFLKDKGKLSSVIKPIMKTKIISNENGKARIGLENEKNEVVAELNLSLLESTKGKTEFKYWAHEYNGASNIDLSDIQDWLNALHGANLIDLQPDEWIREACLYRLNNGKYKTVQKMSVMGKREDKFSEDEKLNYVAKSLEGEAFKQRATGDGVAAAKRKLAASEARGARMLEIFNERRELESKKSKAKGDAATKLQSQIETLDKEANELYA